MDSHDHPTLDIRQLRETIGEDADFERVLLGEYLSQSDEILARLSDAVVTRNSAGIKSAAHELKGSSHTIGAIAMGHLAQQLETMGASGELGAVDETHELMQHEFDRLRVAIHEHAKKAA